MPNEIVPDHFNGEDVGTARQVKALVVLCLVCVIVAFAGPRCQAQGMGTGDWESLTDQARALAGESKLRAAIPIAQNAVQIAKTHNDLQGIGDSLHLLGDLQRAAGDYAGAVSSLTGAMAIFQPVESFRNHDHDIASTLASLAEVSAAEGHYTAAEPLLQRALKLALHDGQDVARCLSDLGNLYTEEGRYVDADPLLFRALDMDHGAGVNLTNQMLMTATPAIAYDLNNLARLDEVAKFGDPEGQLKGALAMNERVLGPRSPGVAVSLSNLAEAAKDRGQYAEAESLYMRARSIEEAANGAVHPAVAASLASLASVYFAQGRYSEAQSLYVRALNIDQRAIGGDSPIVGPWLFNLADAYDLSGNPAAARDLFHRGATVVFNEFHAVLPHMSERNGLALVGTAGAELDRYADFCIRRSIDHPELAGDLYDLALREKGSVLGRVADLRRRVRASGDARAIAMLDQLNDTLTQRAELALEAQPSAAAEEARLLGWERQQAAAAGRPLVGPAPTALDFNRQLPPDELALVTAQLRSRLDAQAEDLERALADLFPNTPDPNGTSWRDVQKKLRTDEAAIELLYVRNTGVEKRRAMYVALIVSKDDADHPKLISLGDAKSFEAEPKREYYQEIYGIVRTPEPSALGTSSFYDAFWKRLEPALANVHRIYYSPDGVLNQMSPALVSIPGANASSQLVLDRFDLRTVASTRDLLQPAARETAAPTAVLFGDPAFGLSEQEQRAALPASVAPTTHHDPAAGLIGDPAFEFTEQAQRAAVLGQQLMKNSRSAGISLHQAANAASQPGCGGQALEEHDAMKQEVVQLGTLLVQHGWHTAVYTGSSAQKQMLASVNAPRILHFATHGSFLPDPPPLQGNAATFVEERCHPANPMLRSLLFFAGANRLWEQGVAPTSTVDDGILTASEAAELNLEGTELVVLSACDTGRGSTVSGEGVFGLRRALQEAGAQSILMSLWQVKSEQAETLMLKFYRHWLDDGVDKHAALRTAQSEMRKAGDPPSSWGAFVLVGP